MFILITFRRVRVIDEKVEFTSVESAGRNVDDDRRSLHSISPPSRERYERLQEQPLAGRIYTLPGPDARKQRYRFGTDGTG